MDAQAAAETKVADLVREKLAKDLHKVIMQDIDAEQGRSLQSLEDGSVMLRTAD